MNRCFFSCVWKMTLEEKKIKISRMCSTYALNKQSKDAQSVISTDFKLSTYECVECTSPYMRPDMQWNVAVA